MHVAFCIIMSCAVYRCTHEYSYTSIKKCPLLEWDQGHYGYTGHRISKNTSTLTAVVLLALNPNSHAVVLQHVCTNIGLL